MSEKEAMELAESIATSRVHLTATETALVVVLRALNKERSVRCEKDVYKMFPLIKSL